MMSSSFRTMIRGGWPFTPLPTLFSLDANTRHRPHARNPRYIPTANTLPAAKSLPLSATVSGGGSAVEAEWKHTSQQGEKSVRVPAQGVQRGGCTVKTPPSKLRYGDRLRLWARWDHGGDIYFFLFLSSLFYWLDVFCFIVHSHGLAMDFVRGLDT